ncbi:extracellular solute-binding protein [Gellertiella hungarica]|uniref:Peptide/nickel transport system substrate-binding protein n=1 Tax=Gellertiella hungarica TaxID=1572859 RepID=A0A7W6J4V1_9HYPH|nr:extracellular solute-binding protein [Gellertiella hungarica]MBB4064797.1 peptide/nickel transport system substrate-binding protein [Gellertiella hungarica]
MTRLFISLFLLLFSTFAIAEPLHGIAMHGAAQLPRDYKAFPYVNTEVKKGGKIAYGVVGTFDSLNPFILKSMRTTARGMWDPEYGNLVFESLMQRSRDENFALYGLLAETVEWDDARSFIQFNINPKAKWSDGQPVTPEDVIFSFELLRDKGRTPFSKRLDGVAKLEKVGDNSVRFTFNEKADRETPLLIGLSPVLPKHATKVETFDQSSLTPPVGSGPYKIKSVNPGTSITYERDPNYWAKDLPSKIGFDNYDQITVQYFLQDTALFEAFKKGDVDIYSEGSPTHWARAYDFPAVSSGDVIKAEFKPALPSGMFGFVFNTRRPVFANAKVRQALSLAFDFEWANKNLFENSYERTQSFWQNSAFSSYGVPASDAEKALLGPAVSKIEPAILDGTYKLPVSDASGRDRKLLRQAVDLMKGAGYAIKGAQMVDPAGKPLAFEIMTQNADQEKLAIAFQRSLKAIGINASIRTVDDSQYQSRTSSFDYDMILKGFVSSLSPGVEQAGRWSSVARDRPGSDAFAGAADPDIDRIIDAILKARSPEEFQTAVRAFDRLLLSGHYLVPLYFSPLQRVAHRATIGHPDKLPLYGVQLSTWWDKRAQ